MFCGTRPSTQRCRPSHRNEPYRPAHPRRVARNRAPPAFAGGGFRCGWCGIAHVFRRRKRERNARRSDSGRRGNRASRARESSVAPGGTARALAGRQDSRARRARCICELGRHYVASRSRPCGRGAFLRDRTARADPRRRLFEAHLRHHGNPTRHPLFGGAIARGLHCGLRHDGHRRGRPQLRRHLVGAQLRL